MISTAIEGGSGTGLEAQSSQTDAVKSLIRWESPHPLSIVGVDYLGRLTPANRVLVAGMMSDEAIALLSKVTKWVDIIDRMAAPSALMLKAGFFSPTASCTHATD